jgi:hypothetical protein
MATQTKLTVGTMLEEKSTGRQLTITGAADCTVAAYGSFQYKMDPSNPPLIYSIDIGPAPTQKFTIAK